MSFNPLYALRCGSVPSASVSRWERGVRIIYPYPYGSRLRLQAGTTAAFLMRQRLRRCGVDGAHGGRRLEAAPAGRRDGAPGRCARHPPSSVLLPSSLSGCAVVWSGRARSATSEVRAPKSNFRSRDPGSTTTCTALGVETSTRRASPGLAARSKVGTRSRRPTPPPPARGRISRTRSV